jgi:dihydroorotase-like cyclic amidohydrolase
MSANPASLLGLSRGLLRAGYDADFALFDPDAEFTVDPESAVWHSRGKNTPLAGKTLSGVVLATFKRGRVVYERGL